MDIDNIIQIEKRITAAIDRQTDADAARAEAVRDELRARWESGKQMLAERTKPKGRGRPGVPAKRMAELVEATRSGRADLSYRMQFAEQYPTEDDLSTALDKFTSWTQVKKSLPKPPRSEHGAPHKPIPHPKHDEVVELHEQGAKRQDIADAVGINPRSVDRIVREERIEETTAPIDWNTAPGTAKQKIESATRRIRKELQKEFRTRLLAELDQHRAKLNADYAAHKAAYDAQNAKINALRDEERLRYQLGIEVDRAKGLIALADYKLMLSCLHPDSRASASDEKLAKAFRLFNDERIKTLLVKEI